MAVSSGYVRLEAHLTRRLCLVACDSHSTTWTVGKVEYISVLEMSKSDMLFPKSLREADLISIEAFETYLSPSDSLALSLLFLSGELEWFIGGECVNIARVSNGKGSLVRWVL